MTPKADLSTVVNFTDPFGRTSSALDEREHYRLRCLALSKIASALKQDASVKRQRVIELEEALNIRHRVPDDFKVALYQRRLKVLRRLLEAAEAKLARVEAEQDPIERRIASAKEICDRVREKLPRELRDQIYEYLGSWDKAIEVDLVKRTQKDPLSSPVVYESKYFGESCSQKSRDTPWYLDTKVVSDDFATEMLETLYRKTTFTILNPRVLDRFLNENRWKGFDNLVPKDMVRKINLILPLHDTQHEEPSRAEMARMLLPLRDLTLARVRLTIDVGIKDQWRGYETMSFPRFIEDLIKDEYEQQEEETRELLQQILPLLHNLSAKGHVVTIKDRFKGWSWVMGKDNVSVYDVVKSAHNPEVLMSGITFHDG
jgi:hypothetical protein